MSIMKGMKFMNKAFRKMSVVLAAVMAVAATSMMPVSAYDWTASSNSVFVEYRVKNTSSSINITNETGNGVYVSVYGAYAANDRTYSVSKCSSDEEVLQTTNLYLPGNLNRSIRQYIAENGYAYAAIYISGNSNGTWNPDTTSPYLNLN